MTPPGATTFEPGDRVRILRGRWCNHTAAVVRITRTSVKVEGAMGRRWYALTEVERSR